MKLIVQYKDKITNEIATRKYDYKGEIDKTKWEWVKDADTIAYGNCKPNEDVMGYKLIEEDKR